MDTLSNLATDLEQLGRNRGPLLKAMGEAWATEARKLAHGTQLPASIRWVQTSDTAGYLEMHETGRWLDEGTKPHDIAPKNKQALAFPGNPGQVIKKYRKARYGKVNVSYAQGSANVVVKKVHHPGTKPTHFIEQAWNSPAVQAAVQALAEAGVHVELA